MIGWSSPRWLYWTLQVIALCGFVGSPYLGTVGEPGPAVRLLEDEADPLHQAVVADDHRQFRGVRIRSARRGGVAGPFRRVAWRASASRRSGTGSSAGRRGRCGWCRCTSSCRLARRSCRGYRRPRGSQARCLGGSQRRRPPLQGRACRPRPPHAGVVRPRAIGALHVRTAPDQQHLQVRAEHVSEHQGAGLVISERDPVIVPAHGGELRPVHRERHRAGALGRCRSPFITPDRWLGFSAAGHQARSEAADLEAERDAAARAGRLDGREISVRSS